MLEAEQISINATKVHKYERVLVITKSTADNYFQKKSDKVSIIIIEEDFVLSKE